jgi:branched-chain amino acid aminotransferase
MRDLQAWRSVQNPPRMAYLWCNDQWLDPLDYSISPFDRGLMHGLGLFETLLAIDGAPVFADQHLARLQHGCGHLGWDFSYPDILETMAGLLRLNDLTEGRARIRLAMTAGSGDIHDTALGADHLVWMTAVATSEPPATTTAILCPWTRNERSALSGLKCASYAENLVALRHAERLGFEETVFLNTAGHVCEAATSNVFLVKNGVVATPSLDSGCLPGITRAVVIGLAGNLGLQCGERNVAADELLNADEIFLTSSIRGVMGVAEFGGRTLEPGPLTHRLREALKAAIPGKKPH